MGEGCRRLAIPQPGLWDERVQVARVEISRVFGGGGGVEMEIVGEGGGEEVVVSVVSVVSPAGVMLIG